MGGNFSKTDMTKFIVHCAQNFPRTHAILLGLHSAAQNNIQDPDEIRNEIMEYFDEMTRIDSSFLSMIGTEPKFGMYELITLQRVYQNCAVYIQELRNFMHNYCGQPDWYEKLIAVPQLSAALAVLAEAKLRCILITYQITNSTQIYFGAHENVDIATAQFVHGNESFGKHVPTNIKPFLQVLANGPIHVPKQFKCRVDAENKSAHIDLATLALIRPNGYKFLEETLSDYSELNVVSIANVNFSELHFNALSAICEILKKIGSIKKLTVIAVIIDPKIDQVAACHTQLRSLYNVAQFDYCENTQGSLTIPVQFRLHYNIRQQEIATMAWQLIRQQALDVAMQNEPRFTYKQVRATFKEPNPALFKDPIFLQFLTSRVRRLHPATIHALYLKAVVLNDVFLEAIVKANLASKDEEVTVRCDANGVVHIKPRPRQIIDAIVLTRYGAKISGTESFNEFETKVYESPVFRRCQHGTRSMLVEYRQSLKVSTFPFNSDLEKLDYKVALTQVAGLLGHERTAFVVAQLIMPYLASQTESRRAKYKPLRELYDTRKYNEDDSERNYWCRMS